MFKFLFLLIAVTFLLGCTSAQKAARPEFQPAKYLGLPEHEEEGGPEATDAAEAFQWRRLFWLDEHGQIAPGVLQNARRQHDENAAYWAAAAGAYGARNAGIFPTGWTERGPSNIGGRTRCLLVHPTQTNRLWAGAVGGGIWASTNSGASWTPVDDRLKDLAVSCMAFDPSNPATMYAGTGEGYFNGDAVGGVGIYKSANSGATWTLMPSTAAFDNVCRIAVSPANPSLILISKRYGGILRSTDAGLTWNTVSGAQGSFQVVFNPTNPTQAVGHIIDYDFGVGNWFHRAVYSTDSGATWTPAGGLSQVYDFSSRIELAYAPSNTTIVYALCNGAIWRSTDSGHNFTQMTTTGSTGSSWYTCAMWVDPTNPAFVLGCGYAVWKSTNSGITVTQISDGYILTSVPHPDIHAFITDPGFNGTTNRRVYVTTDGGVHKAENIYTATTNTGWTSLQPSYRASQFYGARGDGASGRIVGGTQDNGTLRLNPGSNTAALMFGGDGGFCAIDPSNPLYCYGEYINLQICRSTDGGANASYIFGGIADAGSGNANFIAPFILDPNNPGIMLAGGAQLWRSTNIRAATPTWTSIRPASGANISAITVAPGNSNIIWIGLNDGTVYRTSNGTAAAPTWTTVDDNAGTNPLPNRYVGRILIDRLNLAVAYVCLEGFAADNLLRTADNGVHWNVLTGSGPTALPSAPIRGICQHPASASWFYVATEVGIYATSDGGQTWSTSNDGPANTRTDEITFLAGSATLLAATHGRGLWTTPVLNCMADFDGDGDVGTDADIEAFFACLAGNCCPRCGSSDFNGDGDVGTDADIESFFRVLAGGTC